MSQPIEETEEEGGPEPRLFAVSRDADGFHFSRRDFLEAAAATAALALLTGCGDEPEAAPTEPPDTPFATVAPTDTAAPPPTDTPVPTDTPRPTNTPTPTRTPRPTNTPRPTDTPTVAAAEVVARSTTNLRAGPGTAFPIVAALNAGDALPLLGRTADSAWLQVELPPAEAWVSASLVDVNVDLAEVAVIEELPTAPAPVALGTPGPVPEGEVGIEFTVEGQTYTLPCGSPLPSGAVCVCNCVTVPAAGAGSTCTCDQVCTCDSVCSCVGATHYWYPN